jgi:hypothetical protein
MISCRVARRSLYETLRRDASDALRLELESHLLECAACREERARASVVGVLKRYAPPPLSRAAERRINDQLVAATREDPPARAARRLPRWRLLQPALALAAASAIWWARRPVPIAEGQVVTAAAPGRVAFGGAQVAFGVGTSMRLHPAARALELDRGEADVEVTPGLPGRFRVTTPRFIVEVLGTRFVVTATTVRNLHGKVRVLDLGERELIVLQAGEEWSAPGTALGSTAENSPAKPSPALTTNAAPRPEVPPSVAPAPARPPLFSGPRPGPGPRHTAGELLARAKTALADGDVVTTRSLLTRVRGFSPSEGESIAAEQLLAHALLVEGRRDEAIAAYRRVARRSPGSVDGEAAAFTVGQLLLERGRAAEAEAVLNEYLARYPLGRFVREARERLTEIQSAR